MIDKGLVAVAQNDYEEAFKQFQKAHELDKDNILVSSLSSKCNDGVSRRKLF
jgi:Flp pilus assembly protein TadD